MTQPLQKSLMVIVLLMLAMDSFTPAELRLLHQLAPCANMSGRSVEYGGFLLYCLIGIWLYWLAGRYPLFFSLLGSSNLRKTKRPLLLLFSYLYCLSSYKCDLV
ncbi:hypothetical protein F4811DRAFT_467067 [Daldinia bambusicola]|nr:hypothetical protein F4811DRAFT_467067 [Daldinia bambusicola]